MRDFIQIDGISFNYPDLIQEDRKTLDQIRLTIARGEYIAILGANGSGKSTLAKMINALLLPDSGSVHISGLDTRIPENLPLIRMKIGMVFQSPEEQIFSSTIEEDVAFGLENFGWEYEKMHARVKEILTRMDLWDVRQRPSYLLSGGQTQRLALAGVLAIQPDCIIFDEATSMLDPMGRKVVLRQMRQLHEQGKTILHITHSMDEAMEASRVVVLQAGKVVFDAKPEELFSGDYDLEQWNLAYPADKKLLIELRESIDDFPREIHSLDGAADWFLRRNTFPFEIDDEESQADREEISVTQLRHIYLEGTPYQSRALLDVNLNVMDGESHGLIGVTGSGKSTLLQHLNGLLRPQEGSVQVGKFDLSDRKLSRQELVQYVGLVMQNPEVQFFEEYTGDEIAYGPKTVGISESLADRVRWAMTRVGLDFDTFKDRRVNTLSGGEKRKAALASIIALKPDVLLLDEPTAGLDPVAHKQILQVFKEMQAEGTTMVVSSHNMQDIFSLCKNVTVLDHGRSVETGRAGKVLSNQSKLEGMQLVPPSKLKLINLYQQKNAAELIRREGEEAYE